MFEVTDDSGLLAIVVPETYQSFVAKNWEFEQLEKHFKAQMQQRRLLIWGTGLEGYWNVQVTQEKSKTMGVREVSGPLLVAGGSILLTNYESLTMAAAYEHVILPEPHDRDLLISVPDGAYSCRIMQMFDPSSDDCAPNGGPDFLVELLKELANIAPWNKIPWSDDSVERP